MKHHLIYLGWSVEDIAIAYSIIVLDFFLKISLQGSLEFEFFCNWNHIQIPTFLFNNLTVDFYGKDRNAHAVLPIKTDQDTLREGYRYNMIIWILCELCRPSWLSFLFLLLFVYDRLSYLMQLFGNSIWFSCILPFYMKKYYKFSSTFSLSSLLSKHVD